MLKLFHGSNLEISRVDLSKCMPNKGFGCGFYTTFLEEQAWRMAERRARIAGRGVPIVTVYEVPDDLLEKEDLNCRVFADKPTIDVEYMKREFDFGSYTNQYTFHTKRALKYLKKVGTFYDRSAAGND